MGLTNFMVETTATNTNKPHAVCIPYPAQGHINPMLKLAKLLHHKGFHVTFVNSEFNHRRLLNSAGPNALDGLPSFQFKTIPDGLPPTDTNATQDIPSLCASTRKHCLPHFRKLLEETNADEGSPPVSCVVSDGVMSFTLDAAEELGVPEVLFWTTSACGVMAYVQYKHLIEKGYTPLKDASDLTNGYLDTEIDWMPGMKDIRLKDIPSFIRTTDPNDLMIDFVLHETERLKRASAIVINTFDDLEHNVIEAFAPLLLPPVYSIGPLNLTINQIPIDSELQSLRSNLWKEDSECLKWLDTKEPNSVVYVNFGSITVMTETQLIEFAWGLANSKKTFLWVIRPDLVGGSTAVVPSEFTNETKDRSMLSTWCPQEEVLRHPSIGGFLTHSGWNSTLESVCGGVPMICWPFFAEQQTNCRFCCTEWGIGMEIEGDPKRDYVEGLVRKLMEGEEGREMRKKVLEWKRLAMEAADGPKGSSFVKLEKLVNDVLLPSRK